MVNVRAEGIPVLHGDWSFPGWESISKERRPGAAPPRALRSLSESVRNEGLGQGEGDAHGRRDFGGGRRRCGPEPVNGHYCLG